MIRSLLSTFHGIKLLPPKKRDVVIFDHELQDEILILLGSNWTSSTFDSSYKKTIYLLPLIKGLARLSVHRSPKSLTYYYFVEYIRMSTPRAILTNQHYHEVIYSARTEISSFLNCRVIVFQRSVMDRNPAFSGLAKGDAVFALTQKYADKWKRVSPETKVSAVGSLSGKRLIRPEDFAKENNVLYISQWKSYDPRNSKPRYQEFYRLERNHLQELMEAVTCMGVKFEILGRSNSIGEARFYQSILGEGSWGFRSRESHESTYLSISRCSIVVSPGSSLGLESLASKQKTMFLVDDSMDETLVLRHGHPSTRTLAYQSQIAGLGMSEVVSLRVSEKENWIDKLSNLKSMDTGDFAKIAEELLGKSTSTSTHEDISSMVAQLLV